MDKSNHLYLMENTLGVYKIGVSKNPTKRVQDIKNASGFKTEIIFSTVFEDAYWLEKKLHKHFEKKRLEGEWFTKMSLSGFKKAMRMFMKEYPAYIAEKIKKWEEYDKRQVERLKKWEEKYE